MEGYKPIKLDMDNIINYRMGLSSKGIKSMNLLKISVFKQKTNIIFFKNKNTDAWMFD